MGNTNKMVVPLVAATPQIAGIYVVNFDPTTELHSTFDRVAPGTVVIQTGTIDAACDFTPGGGLWYRGEGDCNNQNWYPVTVGAAAP